MRQEVIPITTWLSRKSALMLKRLAKQDDRSISSWVRQAILGRIDAETESGATDGR